ncbi:pyridoxamine 5'-phosphate oxidase family protein [Heliobacterium gestii]|uniref:Pyridoxamine 5'-phosphate oxidase family protein n=1 Tax=Heliomicrobium gestii TaxID=2699 RepID=A0A845L870_HELGE|nr:pyridoxamine 5'-phosphate oxidase family protein [Heliomicrobium gestii]MBM7866269.1 nitroimidazol reductase NimA-like FMN-containing flavoprotein (pyridoxamine 5'-phosphate oxidase superfamily) [Heliomicrobium gestii]MZP42937.1 pyridoxamine 5'-phosphate oxidase family protein [Heliomicrobium gestii]
MEQIRYTKRRCEDHERIASFLAEKRVGTVSMCDQEGKPYACPVNYVYHNGKIYIHGMGSGKKNNILRENPSVCFTVFDEFGTVTDAAPCKCDTAYLSVVLFGQAVLVEDLDEKTQALAQFLEKFTPRFFEKPLTMEFVKKYRSGFDNQTVAVYGISPDAITAKENPVDSENMFR